MTPDDKKEFKDHISAVIQSTVNGKIDALDKKIDVYIEGDEAWKAKAQPIIDFGTDMRGFGRGVAYFVGVMAALSAMVGGIYEALKLIRK